MVKREDTYRQALSIIKDGLAEKQKQREIMLNAAYRQTHRLGEIDRLMSSYGAKIAITALSGDKEALESIRDLLEGLAIEKKIILKNFEVKDITYDCPVCKDSGYVGGKICDCVKVLARKIAMEQLSKEMPLDECRFDNFDLKYYPNSQAENGVNPKKKMTQLFKLCREYALEFSPEKSANLLFMGDSGLGKTHLTLAIVGEVINKGYEVIYGSAYNLLSAVEKENFSYEKGESYEAMLSCDLLVIDDLGTEFSSSFAQTVIYGLINSRILTRKPTIINTNLTMGELEKRYTSRVSSRLIGNYIAKKFFGKDIRQLKSMEN